MKKPRNTSKDHPLLHLAGALSGNDDYIYGMESQGQNELVSSESLPASFGFSSTTKEDLEALGFEFGEPFEDDPLFMPAKIPRGWTKRASDHSMWSDILDERGLRRVAVFYKAAFYDRKAHMQLVNPGREFATNFIYGYVDEVPVDKFTKEERSSFLEECYNYLDDVKKHPDIYGDREEKAREALRLIGKNDETF